MYQVKGMDLAAVLEKYSQVFKDELRWITNVKAKHRIDDSVEPRFTKARHVP